MTRTVIWPEICQRTFKYLSSPLTQPWKEEQELVPEPVILLTPDDEQEQVKDGNEHRNRTHLLNDFLNSKKSRVSKLVSNLDIFTATNCPIFEWSMDITSFMTKKLLLRKVASVFVTKEHSCKQHSVLQWCLLGVHRQLKIKHNLCKKFPV